MDLRQLRDFVGIVTAGSFNRAAEQLYVAQPALSRQIKAPEEELGVQLLFRTSYGVEVTEAGRRLLELAEHLLRSADNVRDEVRSVSHEPLGSLVIGLPPSLAPILAPTLIETAQERYPKVSIRVV